MGQECAYRWEPAAGEKAKYGGAQPREVTGPHVCIEGSGHPKDHRCCCGARHSAVAE